MFVFPPCASLGAGCEDTEWKGGLKGGGTDPVPILVDHRQYRAERERGTGEASGGRNPRGRKVSGEGGQRWQGWALRGRRGVHQVELVD